VSGETEAQQSGWTVDTLRADILARLAMLEQLLLERYATQTKAVDAAFSAAEKRFDSVNEFRGQLSDQAGTFMPRAETEAVVLRLTERIQELSAQQNNAISRTEATAMGQRNSDRIGELTDRINKAEGLGQGTRESRAGIYAAIAAVGVVITIIVLIANFVS
jgi:hypothetical protein